VTPLEEEEEELRLFVFNDTVGTKARCIDSDDPEDACHMREEDTLLMSYEGGGYAAVTVDSLVCL
jgi:hypothetical protein